MSSVTSVKTNSTLEFGPEGCLKVTFEKGSLKGMSFQHLHSLSGYTWVSDFRLFTTCHVALQAIGKKEHWQCIANEEDTRQILLNIKLYSNVCKIEAEAFRNTLLDDLQSESREGTLHALNELNPLCSNPVGSQYALYLAGFRHLPERLRRICFVNQYLHGRPIKLTTSDGVHRVIIELCDLGIKITNLTDGKEFVFVDECLVNSNETIESLSKFLRPADEDISDSDE